MDVFLVDLIVEGEYLISCLWKEVEIMLLIYLYVLSNFFDYNVYFCEVEVFVVEENWEGVLQVVFFYLYYQFGGEVLDVVFNYMSCLFYLMLYLIWEECLEVVLEYYEVLEDIFNWNIVRLEVMGCIGILDLLYQIKLKSKI